jgi:hypothetical protein
VKGRISTLAMTMTLVSIHAGCAALTQKHPSERSASHPADCEVSNRWIVDAIGAGTMLAASIVGVATVTNSESVSNATLYSASTAGWVGRVGALLFSASAYTGREWNHACAEAQEQGSRTPMP